MDPPTQILKIALQILLVVHHAMPSRLHTTAGKLIALPYSPELNDSVLFAAHHYPSGEYGTRVRDTLQTFDRELPRQVRVLTLPLHPHLMGVAHRIGQLRDALASRGPAATDLPRRLPDHRLVHCGGRDGAPSLTVGGLGYLTGA